MSCYPQHTHYKQYRYCLFVCLLVYLFNTRQLYDEYKDRFYGYMETHSETMRFILV